jgi:ABC-2 type transport system ATP-binding protein
MYVKEYLTFIGNIYNIKNLKYAINNIVLRTGLSTHENKKIMQLSKGYKQRVGLAAALIHEPDVLILDEPSTGLDPNQLDEIRKLITEFGKEKTVLLSTHIMQEVDKTCDRVIIINKGVIVADNLMSQLRKDKVNLEDHFRDLTSN